MASHFSNETGRLAFGNISLPFRLSLHSWGSQPLGSRIKAPPMVKKYPCVFCKCNNAGYDEMKNVEQVLGNARDYCLNMCKEAAKLSLQKHANYAMLKCTNSRLLFIQRQRQLVMFSTCFDPSRQAPRSQSWMRNPGRSSRLAGPALHFPGWLIMPRCGSQIIGLPLQGLALPRLPPQGTYHPY